VCDFHKKCESLEQRMAQSQLYAGMSSMLPEVNVSILFYFLLLLLNFVILKCLTFYFFYFLSDFLYRISNIYRCMKMNMEGVDVELWLILIDSRILII
jgi:type III secretory pathway component EscU